jgi:hypothetical protein
MVAKITFLLCLLVSLAGCAIIQTPPITKIVLLAPFEGEQRDLGYNALYAVRLALSDANAQNIDFLAIDDGGTPQNAQDRALALQQDSAVRAILLLGDRTTQPDVQKLLPNVTIIVIDQNNTATLSNIPLDFRERYLASDVYVPEPTHIAFNSYIATQQILQQLSSVR